MRKFEDPFRATPTLLANALKSRAAKWYAALWVTVAVLVALKWGGIV